MPTIDPVIAEARLRWPRCESAEAQQRKSIVAAKKFRGGEQWPEAVRLQREGATSIQGVAAQPPRPCLTIDRISQPIRQVSNIIKQANFAIDVLPNGVGADQETADIIKGYLRKVQNDSRTEDPIGWAADGAVSAGLGWFRIRTDYVHQTWTGEPAPEMFDQEVRLERIPNSLSVYVDPAATKPTKADAIFMFVTEDLAREEFTSRWPKADLTGIDQFCAEGDFQSWADKDKIRIAEYWRIVFVDQKLTLGDKTRTFRIPKVEGYKINAMQRLEEWDWAGSHIPLIPIIGEELEIDGYIMVRGITQEAMDAQRMINYTYSGAMEVFALAPKAPWVAAAGQIDKYKDLWQHANTDNLAYLPYDPITVGGTAAPPPIRQNSEPPIQAAVALMLKSEEAVKATTGIYDPSLEYNNAREHSGRAIQSLQGQSDVNMATYPLNTQRALIYAGEQIVEILPKITRPGQTLHILGVNEEPEQVLVGQPFSKGPNGQPIPMPQVTAEQAKLSKGLHQFYDLNQGKYSVVVTVGKANATKREEGAAALGELIPKLPPTMGAVAAPEYVEQLSFPGAQKIADMMRKTLPPELQQDETDQQQPIPPQVQQQMQQAQQMIDMLAKELQAKTHIIETEQIKAQQDLIVERTKQEGETVRAREKNLAEMQLEKMKLAADLLKTRATLEAKQTEAMIDAEVAELDRRVALAGQREEREAVSQEAERDRQFQADQSAADRASQAEATV